MASWVPIASGRDADVFVLDDHRVLRRYRNPQDTAPEAAVMAHVAALGFPVPGVHRAEGAELEMDRLYGPTMLDAALNGVVTPKETARTLAELHEHLHSLPSRSGSDTKGNTSPSGSGRDRILHMDLHPGNVVLTSGSPVVIDWTNARDGDPDLDLAVTALLFALISKSAPAPLAELAAACLPHYLAHAKGDPARLVDDAADLRRQDPNLGHRELALLGKSADLVRRVQAACAVTGERDVT